MTPIHEVLARIRWDTEFGRGRFEVGYLDHVSGRIEHIELRETRPDPVNPSLLDLIDREGRAVSVPLHRIREVIRNGAVIWRRPAPPAAAADDSGEASG